MCTHFNRENTDLHVKQKPPLDFTISNGPNLMYNILPINRPFARWHNFNTTRIHIVFLFIYESGNPSEVSHNSRPNLHNNATH